MASTQKNVLLLAYPGAVQWECICLNSGLRTNDATLLGCLGVMLDLLSTRWRGDVLGRTPHQPSPAETTEFCNVLIQGEPDSMELAGHAGVTIRAASSLMGTYAVWLVVETPVRGSKSSPTSVDNSGGV